MTRPEKLIRSALADAPEVTAPDGSRVRILPQLAGGSMIHIELSAGAVSHAIAHRSVEELWYILSGRGKMWRRIGDEEGVVALAPGDALTLPQGTRFQFRALGDEPLCAVAVTMPPWPGEDEAIFVEGIW